MPRRCRPSCCGCCRSGRFAPRRRHRRADRVDVRVVAATNRDLAARWRDGALPRGPVLPPERLPLRAAAPARAARGRAAPGPRLPAESPTAGPSRPSARPRPRAGCRPTPGPATCASWRTPSSGRGCWRRTDVILPEHLPPAVRQGGGRRPPRRRAETRPAPPRPSRCCPWTVSSARPSSAPSSRPAATAPGPPNCWASAEQYVILPSSCDNKNLNHCANEN